MSKKRKKRIKKRVLIPYLLLGAVGVAALFFLVRANKLQYQLKKSVQNQVELLRTKSEYQELIRIDSILVAGDYQTALDTYNSVNDHGIERDGAAIQLRIALAQKMLQFQKTDGGEATLAKNDSIDSTRTNRVITPIEIRQYDSLNFALEKAKVQLSRMKRQLKGKAFGEYLTFKSKKGNTMHYVGQVKNGKANGTGIALLDTGSRYEGEWEENQRVGEGTFYWADGEYYVGSYSNDRRNGEGSYFWPNGEKYIGQWKDDKRNGNGSFYGADGKIVTSGIWKNDKLVETKKK